MNPPQRGALGENLRAKIDTFRKKTRAGPKRQNERAKKEGRPCLGSFSKTVLHPSPILHASQQTFPLQKSFSKVGPIVQVGRRAQTVNEIDP